MQVLIEPIEGGVRAASGAPWNLTAEGATEAEALARFQEAVAGLLRSGARVIDLPIPDINSPTADRPWMRFAGDLKDEPLYESWQESISAYRQERDTEDAEVSQTLNRAA